MDLKALFEQYRHVIFTSGVRVLLIVVGTLVVIKLASALLNRLLGAVGKPSAATESQKRAATVAALIRYILIVGLVALALVMILDEFGVKIGPILAAAGVLGLAVGFGAQHLVQDVISGFFILLEDQIRVGDYIETAGKSGFVDKVNLRMVVLRDFQGRVHYIRNGMIDVVTNVTKEWAYATVDMGVAYRENYDDVVAVMREVAADLQADPEYAQRILEPIDIMGLDEFGDSAIVIKARIKVVPVHQWRVAREFRRRLKKTFDERGIEIPYPHLTLYAGQDKTGKAAPLRVVVDERPANPKSSS
jgi:small-conductance mechanosensitive channel